MADLANITLTEEQYRKQWESKTGRAPSDIYIPMALRGDEYEKGNDEAPEGCPHPENRGA